MSTIITHIVLMGVGGTGSFLAEPLVRLLRFHPNVAENASILLIDGDKFEEKNQTRQLFPVEYVGRRKALVVKNEINRRLTVANVSSHNLYVKRDDLLSLLPDEGLVLFISCVDNNASRVEAMNALDVKGVDYVFMSPGNGLSTGQVIAYARIQGEIVGEDLREFDRSYQNPDRNEIPVNRHIAACTNEQISTPQLISANMMAASLTLVNVQVLLDHQCFWGLIQFSNEEGKVLYGDAYVLLQ